MCTMHTCCHKNMVTTAVSLEWKGLYNVYKKNSFRSSFGGIVDMSLIIRNAKIRGYAELQDICISGEKILKIVSSKNNSDFDGKIVDVQGCYVYPSFVNAHFHLDKVLMTDSATEDSTYIGGKEVGGLSVAKEKLTAKDVIRRGEKIIELAMSSGTTYIRSNVDIDPIVGFRALEGVLELQDKYSDKLYIELVAFPQEGFSSSPKVKNMLEEALKMGVEIIGGKPASDPMDKKGHIDTLIELAKKYDRDLDIHIDTDMNLDYNNNVSRHKDGKLYPNDLEVVYLAEQVIEHGLEGNVTVGHLVALDCLKPQLRSNVIELLVKAKINVVTCPTVSLYEMGRDDSYNTRRGVTNVKELMKSGVNTAYGTDNVGDAFNIFASADMMMHGIITAMTCHMKTAKEIETIMDMSTIIPAKIMKLHDYGLKAGGDASLIVFDGNDFYDIFVNNKIRKQVYSKGKLVAINWHGHMLVP